MSKLDGRDGAATVNYIVHGLESIAVAKKADLVGIIGTKKSLSTDAVSSFVQSLSDLFGAPVAEVWDASLKAASAGDAGHSNKFSFVVAGKLKHVFIGVVPDPSTLSRHNADYAVGAVTTLTATASRTSGVKSGLLVFVAEPDELFSVGCASASVFSIFSRKTSGKAPKPASFTISLCSTGTTDVTSTCARVQSVAASIREVAYMGDAPADVMSAGKVVAIARDVHSSLEDMGKKVDINVLRMKELVDGGFGGIVGVGIGASVAGPDREPALVHLSHTFGSPDEPNARNFALCGKGIIFDTGGLSIKSRTGMCNMKVDMLGAATVLYAFKSAVEIGAIQSGRLDALLCVAENSVSAMATRPDDILTMHSGRTVQITNTDAEGRLVVSDGVSYAAKNLEPDYIITTATLTGAQGISTGKRHCAVMATSEMAEKGAVQAGKHSGDTCFPVLYAPELLKKEFASKVADMLNSVKDRSNAQVSCAGQFIANNLPEGYLENGGNFVHLDIAATSFKEGRCTGFGVALLVELLATYTLEKYNSCL